MSQCVNSPAMPGLVNVRPLFVDLSCRGGHREWIRRSRRTPQNQKITPSRTARLNGERTRGGAFSPYPAWNS
jgi:hypothetical protein